MRGLDFLKAINGLDASMIAEAGQEEAICRMKKYRKMKAAAAAVLLCVCLMAGGGAAAAAVMGIDIFNFSSGENTSSYDVAFQVGPKPLSAFTGGLIETLREVIPKQFEEYKPWDSWMPGAWSRNFEDWESAIEFLGVDFLKAPLTSREAENVELDAYGREDGTLLQVSLTGRYPTEDNNIFVNVRIYTEASGKGTAAQTFSATGGDAEYDLEEYATAGGTCCRIVQTSEVENNGAMSEGYFVKDGILYSITVIAPEGKGDERENRTALLRQLLEEAAGQ